MTKKIIIAIDGYSSTGKSTLALMLSSHLGYQHINTGSMYRAVTLHAIRNKWIDCSLNYIKHKDLIIKSVDDIEFKFCLDEGRNILTMNNEIIDYEIKQPLVSKYVSEVSSYPLLRKKIVKQQRLMGKLKGVVMEGRDIGSVVFPDAEFKLFITASCEIRAQRRYKELLNLGIKSNLADVLNNLKTRDFADTHRKDSPLVKVDDAILIDNTFLSLKQQFQRVIDLLSRLE